MWTSVSPWAAATCLSGACVERMMALVRCAHEGQTVLTGQAWRPGRAHAILFLFYFITFIEPHGATHGELNQPSHALYCSPRHRKPFDSG